MSTTFPKHQLAGVVPHTVSVTDVAPGRRGPIVRALARLRGVRCRRATMNELNAFSEHELADIGLNRCDIPRVFDPSFAAEYDQRG